MTKRFVNELSTFMPRVMREFARRNSNVLTKGAITVPQMIVLEILYEKKMCTMSGLAKDIGVTTSAVTGITDRLIRIKLIKRERGVRDRRIVFVTPTQKGKNLIRKLLNQRKNMLKMAFSSLSDTERKTYLKLIQKIYAGIVIK